MIFTKPRNRANSGFARILETVVASLIIFVVFAASSFFVDSSQIKVVQERTDLDRLGYNVLNQLTESGAIETTIEKALPSYNQLKAYLQHTLPSSVFYNFTILTWSEEWVNPQSLSNTDSSSFSNSLEVSSTPMIYTSKSGKTYYLVLILANAGEGA